jgi:tetratricopeptide (TPR) repeat protein
MGKKRGKKRKHLFLHGAYLLAILLLSAGCTAALNNQKISPGREQLEQLEQLKHLEQAEKLAIQGDYDGALKEDDEVVRHFPAVPPGDRALFHMGLIWAHPDNPNKDYKKTLEYFQHVIRDFPGSALTEEVRVWTVAINELTLCESRIQDRDESINVLKKQINTSKEQDMKLESKNRYLEETVKSLGETVRDLEETVGALKKQITAMKEIDIGIEEKKRQDLPGK